MSLSNDVPGALARSTPAPDQACCAHCRYSVVQQMPPPNIGKVRQCKRFPPNIIAVPMRGGLAMQSMWPTVDETSHCFEFEPAAEPAKLVEREQ